MTEIVVEELIPTMNAIADMTHAQCILFHDILISIDDKIKYNPASATAIGTWFKGALGMTQYTKLTAFYETLFGNISDLTKYKKELQDFIKLIFNDKKYSKLYSKLYYELDNLYLFPLPSPLATETYKKTEYKCTISDLKYIDCKDYYLTAAHKMSGTGGSRKSRRSRKHKRKSRTFRRV